MCTLWLASARREDNDAMNASEMKPAHILAGDALGKRLVHERISPGPDEHEVTRRYSNRPSVVS